MKAYIINGMGGCGKDTFVDMLRVEMVYSEPTPQIQRRIINVSSVAQIKKMASEYFGYFGQKTPDWRKFLSDLKDLQTKTCDGPFKYMLSLYSDNRLSNNIMFFHIREPDEIKRLVEATGAETILLTRDGLEANFGNHADDGVANYEYDHVIENNGTLKDFKETVRLFVNKQINA